MPSGDYNAGQQARSECLPGAEENLPIRKDAVNPPARKVSLIPRPCEALYPAGFLLNCQGS